MKGVQCYELFGGIALKNHAFSFFSFLQLEFQSIFTMMCLVCQFSGILGYCYPLMFYVLLMASCLLFYVVVGVIFHLFCWMMAVLLSTCLAGW